MLGTVSMEKTPRVPARWHAHADIFPWMEGGDRAALVEDVRRNGVIEPIVFLDGAVLDGRNRYTVARELGIEYPRCDYTGNDPLGFVISRNLARRHLSESQRAMVAGTLAKMTREDAGRIGGKAEEATANLRLLPDDPQPISVEQAAEMLNVSTRSVESAKKVIRKGVPELAEAVKADKIAVSAAAEIANQPEPVQREVVALSSDKRVEKLKAMRAEAKAIRASLLNTSVAKRIVRKGGLIADRTASIQSSAADYDQKRTELFHKVSGTFRTLERLTATAEQVVASVPAMSVEGFDKSLRAAVQTATAILSRWDGRNATDQ